MTPATAPGSPPPTCATPTGSTTGTWSTPQCAEHVVGPHWRCAWAGRAERTAPAGPVEVVVGEADRRAVDLPRHPRPATAHPPSRCARLLLDGRGGPDPQGDRLDAARGSASGSRRADLLGLPGRARRGDAADHAPLRDRAPRPRRPGPLPRAPRRRPAGLSGGAGPSRPGTRPLGAGRRLVAPGGWSARPAPARRRASARRSPRTSPRPARSSACSRWPDAR